MCGAKSYDKKDCIHGWGPLYNVNRGLLVVVVASPITPYSTSHSINGCTWQRLSHSTANTSINCLHQNLIHLSAPQGALYVAMHQKRFKPPHFTFILSPLTHCHNIYFGSLLQYSHCYYHNNYYFYTMFAIFKRSPCLPFLSDPGVYLGPDLWVRVFLSD